MSRLLLTTIAFAAAAGVNTASVAVQQRWSFLTRRFGRRGWYVHLALILPAWIAFLALLPGVGRRLRWPLPERLRPLGTVLLTAAGILWLLAFVELGPARTANGDQFGRVPKKRIERGVFRLLANPMYDSYALAFVGAALRSANAVFLLLAAECVLFCNLIEAHVENGSRIR